MNQNILLKIQYIGTNYCGWQKQNNGKSIQQEIERAICEVTGKQVNLIGSGRTDRGVHALGQVANFVIDTTIPVEKIKYAINYYLPDDIRIIESKAVEDSFHARYSSKKKTYCYRINMNEIESPFEKNRSYFVGKELDLSKMKEQSKFLMGEHDFAAFQSEGSSVKTTVRTIYSLEINCINNIAEIHIIGNGFLYNMVRIIAGTLIEIGKGKNYSIVDILNTKQRENAGPTAPACGLFMEKVEYD